MALPSVEIWGRDLLIGIKALGILIGFIIGGKVALHFIDHYVKRLTAKTATDLDDLILQIVRTPIYFVTLAVGVVVVVRYLGLPLSIRNLTEKGFRVFSILLATWVAGRISRLLIDDYLCRFADRTHTRVDDTVLNALEKFALITIYAIGLFTVLGELGLEITPLIASLGIGGIAVAFAAQDILANLFAGIFLLLDRPFKVGDRLVLESGELCDVMEVSLRTTRLLDIRENTFVSIPNEKLASSKLINVSRPDARYKVRIEIGVAYGSPVKRVKELLLEIAGEAPHALQDPAPAVFFMEHADFSLNFLLILWIEDFRKKLVVIDFLHTEIDRRFAEEKIEIPFPVRTVYLEK
jgi:MscS family membrane protein